MSKPVRVLLVLAVVAAAGLFLLRFVSQSGQLARASELVPATTVIFMEVPDVEGSLQRWRGTALCKVWNEPEVQNFLARAREEKALGFGWVLPVSALEQLGVGEMFLAVTSVNDTRVQWVAGAALKAGREDIDTLLGHPLAAYARSLYPKGKVRSTVYGSTQIDILEDGKGLLAAAYFEKWYVVGSDVETLQEVLGRLENRRRNGGLGIPEGVLASDPAFDNAVAQLPSKRDVLVYGQLGAVADRIRSGLETRGRGYVGSDELTARQPFAAALSMEGLDFRDVLFFPRPGGQLPAALERHVGGLTNSGALLNAVMRMPAGKELLKKGGLLGPVLEPMRRQLARLELSGEEIDRVFGPEVGLSVNWADGAMQPSLLMAIGVKEPEAAHSVVEGLTKRTPNSPAWTEKNHGGTTFYAAPAERVAFIRPTMAMKGGFLLYSLGQEAVESALDQLDAGPPSGQYAPVQAAVGAPTGGYGDMDLQTLVARAYVAFRPVIEVSLGMAPGWGRYLEARKLPGPDALSKHLGRSVFSEHAGKTGIRLESAGALTLNQVIVGGAIATVLVGMPESGKGMNGEKR